MSQNKIEAILSAKDDGLTQTLTNIASTLKSLNKTVKQISEIMIDAKDNATPKLKKVKSEADTLKKSDAKINVSAKDNATNTVNSVKSSVEGLAKSPPKVVLEARDRATKTVDSVNAKIRSMSKASSDVPITAKDKASKVIDSVKSKARSLAQSAHDIAITAKDKASALVDKAKEKLKSLAGQKTAPTIDAKDGPFNQKIQSVKDKLSALSNATGMITFGFLQQAGQKAFSALTGSIDGAISRYDTLTQFPKVMQQMGYSTADAQKNINKLSDGIDGLPTTLDGIVSNAKNLTLTLGNLDKGTDTAIAFNNAMLASGASTEDADRALTQYTQMLANGKVDMESWTSMQTAGKYALTEVAKKLGIASGSTQDLYEKLKDGTISIDQFNDALIETAGSGSELAKTARMSIEGIGTSLKNLANAGKKGLANLFSTIDKGFASSGISIAGSIDSLKGTINGFFNGLNTAATRVIGVLTDIGKVDFSTLKGSLETIKKTLSSAFDNFVNGGALEKITIQFSNLANLAVQCASKVIGAFDGVDFSFLDGVLQGLTGKFKATITVVGKLFDKLKDTGTMEKVTAAFGKIGEAVDRVFQSMANSGAMDKLLDLFVQLVGVLADAASAVADFISGIDGDILGNVVTGVVGAIAAFKGLNFLQGFNPVQSFLNKFKSGTKETFNTSSKLAQIIKAAFDGIAKVIKTAGTAIADAAKGIGKGLEIAFKGIASASKIANPVGLLALAAVIVSIGAALALVASQGQGVAAIIAGVGTAFANAAPFVTALGDAIGVIVEAIGTALAEVLTAIAPYVENFANAFATCATGIAEAVAIIVEAITPLVDVVMQNFNQLVAIVGNAIAQIITACGPFIPNITQMVETVVSKLPEIINAFSNLLSEVSPIIDSIGDAIEKFGSAIEDALDGVSGVIDSVGGLIKSFFDGISGVIDSVGNAALNAGKGFEALARGVAKITSLNLLDMGASLAAVAAGIANISAAAAGLGGAAGQLNALVSALSGVAGPAMSASASLMILGASASSLGGQLSSLGGASSAAFSQMGAGAQQGASLVKTALNQMIQAMTQAVARARTSGTQIGTGLSNGVRTGMSRLPSIASSALSSMFGILSGAAYRAYSCGMYIGQGLANGLSASVGAVQAAAARLAAAADAAIRAKAQIHSPAKVTVKDGRYIGMGLVNGLNAMKSKVATAMDNLWNYGHSINNPMAFAFSGGSFSQTSDYGFGVNVNVDVPLVVNGREFAKATAGDYEEVNEQRNKFKQKMKGVR